MSDYFTGPGGSHGSADAMFRQVMRDILVSPESGSVSTGAAKVQDTTTESLGYSIELTNPLDRIVSNEKMKFDLPVAVARFVWMISGNNRLADIKFYQEKVADFSDDGIIVPGSSYGARIRYAFPGIDQLQGVIDRLKKDPNSRRAAISIYQPTDTTRDSKDVPCAFGMFFHIRNDQLHTQIVMRSNNATILLPFNVFEFSLLAEVIASECGVTMGPLRHYAASMHIYDKMKPLSVAIANEGGAKHSKPMDRMPVNPKPLEEVKRLVEFEADLRHKSEAISDHAIADWIDRIKDDFSVYWQQFAFSLLITVARRKCSDSGLDELKSAMNPELAHLVAWEVKPEQTSDDAAFSATATLLGSDNIVLFHDTKTSKSLQRNILEHEGESGEKMPTATIFKLQERYTSKLAARSDDVEISRDDFRSALKDIDDGDE